jgi:hypothetical protein
MMKVFSSTAMVIAAFSVLGACKLSGNSATVMGGYQNKPGSETQNGGGGPGQETQNGGGNSSSLPQDPDWKMKDWQKELCRCAGHEKDPDPRKSNYIKGVCYTEVNSEYDNRGICAKQCTEIMDKAGGKGAQGCRNASEPPADPSDSGGKIGNGGGSPQAPVPPADPGSKAGGEVQK